jgi:hypothetical protein
VIVIPSNDLAFVSDMMTRISRIDEDTYPIQVYGLDEWMNYENIEASYKNRLRLRIVSPIYKNFSHPHLKRFLREYRERYGEEPSHFDYGYLGFDLTLFFGKALLKYGKGFPNAFDQLELEGVVGHYRYGKSTTGKEFENKEVFILEYEDYQLKQVN